MGMFNLARSGGEVYQATDSKLGCRRVSPSRFFPQHSLRMRNRLARFEREARAGLVEMNVSSAGWGCPENQPVHAHRILARRTTAGDLRSG